MVKHHLLVQGKKFRILTMRYTRWMLSKVWNNNFSAIRTEIKRKEDHHRWSSIICSCEKKAWKKSGLYRIRILVLCDTGIAGPGKAGSPYINRPLKQFHFITAEGLSQEFEPRFLNSLLNKNAQKDEGFTPRFLAESRRLDERKERELVASPPTLPPSDSLLEG